MNATDLKKQIVETAIHILSTEGTDALSREHIITQLGISDEAFAGEFEDMDLLYAGILEYLADCDLTVKDRKHHDIWEYIYDTTETFFNALAENRKIYAAMFFFLSKSLQNKNTHEKLRARFEAMLQEWKQDLFSHIDGDLPESEKDHIVRIIDMYFGGLLTHSFIFNDPDRYKIITEEFMDMIVSHIEKSVLARKNNH